MLIMYRMALKSDARGWTEIVVIEGIDPQALPHRVACPLLLLPGIITKGQKLVA